MSQENKHFVLKAPKQISILYKIHYRCEILQDKGKENEKISKECLHQSRSPSSKLAKGSAHQLQRIN